MHRAQGVPHQHVISDNDVAPFKLYLPDATFFASAGNLFIGEQPTIRTEAKLTVTTFLAEPTMRQGHPQPRFRVTR